MAKRWSHFTIILAIGLFLGCGLDGIRGELLRIEGEHYVLKQSNGEETRVWVDDRTQKDPVKPGDQLQVFVTKDGHAQFVQRME